MTDHDLLIRLNEQVDMLQLMFSNHLHHHLLYTLALLGGFISTATAFVLYLLNSRKQRR